MLSNRALSISKRRASTCRGLLSLHMSHSRGRVRPCRYTGCRLVVSKALDSRCSCFLEDSTCCRSGWRSGLRCSWCRSNWQQTGTFHSSKKCSSSHSVDRSCSCRCIGRTGWSQSIPDNLGGMSCRWFCLCGRFCSWHRKGGRRRTG